MYAEARRNNIIKFLEQNGSVDVAVLAKEMGTSRETIRRDLKDLENRGLLVKTHGGAVPVRDSNLWSDIPYMLRQTTNAEGKNAVAARAAQCLATNDLVYMDNSTTVCNMVKYMDKTMSLTILTNSIQVLVEIAKVNSSAWKAFSMGGELTVSTLSTVGVLTARNLAQFKPTKAFLSCHGIDESLKTSDGTLNDAEIKLAVLQQAQETFLLADSNKLGRFGVVNVADANQYKHVVVEKTSDPVFLEKLQKAGVALLLADPV